jgi:signal transduction histidine kinase
MTQVDVMLFERLENVRTWTRLEVMQDLRVGDIDKRLSRVLTDLRVGHEVYALLFCTATGSDTIVAASDAQMLGRQQVIPSPWRQVRFAGTLIDLSPLSTEVRAQHMQLGLHATIPDAFQAGHVLGTLHVMFDWEQIFHILDQVEQTDVSENRGRMALLVDRDGHVLAASSLLRQRGLLFEAIPMTWTGKQQPAHTVIKVDGQPFTSTEVLVGYSPGKGYQHFQGLGWSTLVVQSTPQAFQAIRRMAWSFLALLFITGVLATAASLVIASRLANPIVTLTDFTRQFTMQRLPPTPPDRGSGEVGELTRAFLQMIDDLERSREELVRAAKLAVVGELAAAMAHEVRTPLGIVRSSAQILQRERQLSPRGQEMAGFIVSESDRLNRLVSTLLDLARPQPPLFRSEDVHAIIQHAIELLQSRAVRREISIHPELQATSPIVPCDREQLMQVFLNLLLNALQVLPRGGAVTVRTLMAPDTLRVEVSDNGPGIPLAQRRRVFESFFTTREDGIGLGLAIVQQIMRAHGGDITVDDSPTGGACFRLTLPLTRNGEM